MRARASSAARASAAGEPAGVASAGAAAAGGGETALAGGGGTVVVGAGGVALDGAGDSTAACCGLVSPRLESQMARPAIAATATAAATINGALGRGRGGGSGVMPVGASDAIWPVDSDETGLDRPDSGRRTADGRGGSDGTRAVPDVTVVGTSAIARCWRWSARSRDSSLRS